MSSEITEFAKVVSAMKASDGDGAGMLRVIGTPKLDDVDPFLMFVFIFLRLSCSANSSFIQLNRLDEVCNSLILIILF